MATYQITFAMDNDAFVTQPGGAEVARILHELAERCKTRHAVQIGCLRDINGKTVGVTKVIE